MTDMKEVRTAARLGGVVRNRRLKLGMTQEQLARDAGVSPKSIVTLEMGRAGGIRFDKLRAVLAALGMSVYVGAMQEPDTRTYEQFLESFIAEAQQ